MKNVRRKVKGKFMFLRYHNHQIFLHDDLKSQVGGMYPAPQWMPLRQKWQLMHTYNFCQSSPQGTLVIKTQIFPAPWNALIGASNSKQQTKALRRCTALSHYIDFMQLQGWFWIFWQNSCRWKQDICCQRFHSSVNVHLNILAKTLATRRKDVANHTIQLLRFKMPLLCSLKR